MGPACEQVARTDVLVRRARLALLALGRIALQGDPVGAARRPVEAESTLGIGPMIVRRRAGLGHGVGVVEALGVEAEGQVVAELAAVAQGRPPLLASPADLRQSALGLGRGLGDDVDDAAIGVGAPERRPRAADHLDPVDVIGQHLLHVPVDALEQGRIDGAAVDQHQQLVSKGLVGRIAAEAPGTDHIA